MQSLDDGSQPRPISPEGIRTNALSTPDGRFVWGALARLRSCALSGRRRSAHGRCRSCPQPTQPLQWSTDGQISVRRAATVWPPEIDRIDTATGRRAAWRTVFPADPVGIDNIVRILITPDGTSYCHDYARLLTNLFVVDEFK